MITTCWLKISLVLNIAHLTIEAPAIILRVFLVYFILETEAYHACL